MHTGAIILYHKHPASDTLVEIVQLGHLEYWYLGDAGNLFVAHLRLVLWLVYVLGEFPMTSKPIMINRAPVMTLWAAVVAERLGYDEQAALTLGKSVAGLNAQAKGRRLGIYEAPEEKEAEAMPQKDKVPGEQTFVSLLGRSVPAVYTKDGLRALDKDKPADPRSVQRYLEQKFGENLVDARAAMQALAESMSPGELSKRAYSLYEQFRPEIPEGKRGWGAVGELDLGKIKALSS